MTSYNYFLFMIFQIKFPGVRWYTFHKLMCYFYTDGVPPISASRCISLLELANRLCLNRLINLVETRVIEDLDRISQTDTNEAVDLCLRLLEPVKVYYFDLVNTYLLYRIYYCFSYTMHIT